MCRTVHGRAADSDIAEQLAGFERVALVNILMGNPSIALLVMAADLGALRTLTLLTLAQLEGVNSAETFVFSEIVKCRSELVAV